MTWQFDAVGGVAVKAILWRMLAPRWSFDPLSGEGAARAGGRWNEPGQPALYLSDNHATAIAEYHQDLPRPGTLVGYELDAASLLDLTDPLSCLALGIDGAFMRQAWKRSRDIDRARPTCWDFARQAMDGGWHGLRVPSAQVAGTNVVLWRWNQPGCPSLRCLDPRGDCRGIKGLGVNLAIT